jgi:hypothetical protein
MRTLSAKTEVGATGWSPSDSLHDKFAQAA